MTTRAKQRAAPASDAELMTRLAGGDVGALGELYDRHQEPLRRFVARATNGAHDVDDLVHTTFLAAASSAARYDGRASCRPWLVGIAVQHLRRRGQAFGRLAATLSSLRSLTSGSVDPRSAFSVRTDVERALGRLSEAKRVTILLVEGEGMTCPEAAEMLRVPVGTIWTRLHAARQELRDALAEKST